MDQRTITSSEFRKTFGEVLDEVMAGCKVVITNHKKPWVKLTPPEGNADVTISAFDLRLNIKELLSKVHHTKKIYGIVRKGSNVADLTSCSFDVQTPSYDRRTPSSDRRVPAKD